MIGEQLTTVEQSLSNRNWDLARNHLMTAQHNWEKSSHWWSILIDHQAIDAIDLSINRLEKFIETKNFSLSVVEASALKLRFKYIYESEKLSLKNIL